MEFPEVGVKLSYITGQFLDEIGGVEAVRGLTTSQVCKQFIKPITQQWECSYAQLLQNQGHPAFDASPEVFISHAHSYPFLDLISALQCKLALSHNERDDNSARTTKDNGNIRRKDVVVWLDLFSINQHATTDWTFDWLSNTFQSNVRKIGKTIMVMSPWDNPLPFTRSWCVFEAYCTAVTGSKFEIAMSKTDEAIFLQDVKRDPEERMHQMMSCIRAEKSQCSVVSDKEAIFDVIRQTVGFARLDAMVFEQYGRWVLQVSMEALDRCKRENDVSEELTLRQTIGCLLQLQGKYSEAEVYFRECLEASKELLGEDHPDVLKRMGLLGRILTKQGLYDNSKLILESCVERAKGSLGEDHMDSFHFMYLLADVCYCRQQYEEARALYQSVYKGRKALVGADHPKTLRAKNRLAAVLSNEQRYEEACIIVEECFEKRKMILGDDHPHTLLCMSRWAVICYNLGDYDKAHFLGHSCLERQKTALGEDHPHTLLSMSRLSAILYKQGRISEAMDLNKACHERQKKVLGEDHPQTLFTLTDLSTMRL